MPHTSTSTYVDSVSDENVRLWPRADMRRCTVGCRNKGLLAGIRNPWAQCTHAAVKPRCAQMPHVSNDMIARRNFGTPEQQTTVAIKSVEVA
jgi:hypothetical protein